jgi:hypothetical protein
MAKKTPAETPLYVRLPSAASEKLDRAAEVLGVHKKDLVAGLVSEYVDPDNDKSLSALGALSVRNSRPLGTLQVGTYSFQAYDPPEVMNSEQAGLFLQIDEKNVIELAEAGKIPGKKLGPVWRFSREALIAWLSTPEPEKKSR